MTTSLMFINAVTTTSLSSPLAVMVLRLKWCNVAITTRPVWCYQEIAVQLAHLRPAPAISAHARGIDHALLNAKQDAEEATIIAAAGQRGSGFGHLRFDAVQPHRVGRGVARQQAIALAQGSFVAGRMASVRRVERHRHPVQPAPPRARAWRVR